MLSRDMARYCVGSGPCNVSVTFIVLTSSISHGFKIPTKITPRMPRPSILWFVIHFLLAALLSYLLAKAYLHFGNALSNGKCLVGVRQF